VVALLQLLLLLLPPPPPTLALSGSGDWWRSLSLS
jgi:hypothetical protein